LLFGYVVHYLRDEEAVVSSFKPLSNCFGGDIGEPSQYVGVPTEETKQFQLLAIQGGEIFCAPESPFFGFELP
jgi:hypothetical protein